MRRAQLIVNPASGRRHGAALAAAIESRLRRRGYAVATAFTPERGAAQAIAARTDWRTSLIVVVGGDGTLNEVVNGCPKAPLALAPAGTANAFARDQGLVASAEFLEALVTDGVIEWLDLGEASGRRFVNMASCGILGQVQRAIGELRGVRKSHLRLAAKALGVLRRRRFPPVAFSCDGAVVPAVGHALVVSNTRTYAPGITFTPEASPVDGLLDAVILPAPRGHEYLRWLLAVRRGERIRDPRIRYVRGRTIRTHGTGIDWEVDGEYAGDGPLRISVLPRCLPILLPDPAGATAARGRPTG